MGTDFIKVTSECFGRAYEVVIIGVASRIQEVPSLIVGSFALPHYAQSAPHEFGILVSTKGHRHKILSQLQGIFHHLDDGTVMFRDGGVELELRLRVYTCDDIRADLDWFRVWWCASESSYPSRDWLRLPRVDVSMAFCLLRDKEDDQAAARLLLNLGALDSESDLPPRIIALAAQLYTNDLNRIADALEELEEGLE
jgi:hypothetical protein